MTFHPAWLAALAAAALAPCQLAAQTCGLKNHYRIVNSVNNVPSSELRVDSGWQAVGPLASPGSNSGSNPQGCLSQGTCHPVADYGYLSVQGAGSATTCVAGGVFLWLDEWIGGEPKAQFRDTMTVTSNTLAPGTPVQLLWAVKLDGYATTTSSSPSIQPFVDYRVRLYCNWATMVDTQATGTSVGLCNTSVGSSLPIHGQLLATLRENGVLYGLPNTGSYALDLAAGFSVVSLTPGVTLTTCSGAAYDGLLARARPVGVGCGAVPPSLAGTAPVLGASSVLTMAGAPPGQPVVLALAAGAAVWAPLGSCTVQVDPDALIVFDLLGASDGGGTWSHILPIPFVQALAGTTVTAQALPLLTNGPMLGLGELSNGVELRLGY